MAQLIGYEGKSPRLGPGVYLAAGARLVGDVAVGEGSSIWFNAVLRGDMQPVRIGQGTNLQDGAVCHTDHEHPCEVGDHVTAGHNAILHGCTIGDEVLVGMGAVLMNGVVVESQCIIGANSLLTEGLRVPAGSLVYGSPAKVISQLGPKERAQIRGWAAEYSRLAAAYLRSG